VRDRLDDQANGGVKAVRSRNDRSVNEQRLLEAKNLHEGANGEGEPSPNDLARAQDQVTS
jgi:hypothetical protein